MCERTQSLLNACMTSVADPVQSRSLATVESARGFAALMVVMFHASTLMAVKTNFGESPLAGFFGFGYAGVIFFFVLSGFVMFYAHHRDIGQPREVRPFLLKRLIRIYPVYWVVFAAVLVMNVVGNNPVLDQSGGLSYVVSSFFLWPVDTLPLLNVAWTLTHEMLFYVLFALLLYRKSLGVAIFLAWLVAILGASLSSMEWSRPMAVILNRNNVEFFLGMFVAYIFVRGNRLKRAGTWLLVGLALFIAGGVLDVYAKTDKGIMMLVYAFSSGLMLLALVSGESNREFYVHPLFKFLGASSYSIYLVHLPALLFYCRFIVGHSLFKAMPLWMVFVGLVILATVTGMIFHLVVEQPLLRLLRRRVGVPSATALPEMAK